MLTEPDVLIVGSGPIGATYARILVDEGYQVQMVEAGGQESEQPGEHKKNAVNFQKDIDSFVHVIKGSLHTTSIPTTAAAVPTLPPISFKPVGQIFNGQNPNQDPTKNLDANAVSRNVGGMSTHWTCATPEQHDVERSKIFEDERWRTLYEEARNFIGTRNDVVNDSIRQQLVLWILNHEYDREAVPLPLAAKRNHKNTDYIIWSSSHTILEPILHKKDEETHHPLFDLESQCICEKLEIDEKGEVQNAHVFTFRDKKRHPIKAKKYIICGGPILTPQLLYASGFRPEEKIKDTPCHLQLPALGHYLTEQTMSFCQVVLKDSWIKGVKCPDYNPYDPKKDAEKHNAWNDFREEWKDKVKKHLDSYKNDPIPFPFNDQDPQVTLPLSDGYRWHTQIHRDAFSYGAAPPGIDKRTIVDLRFFGMVHPNKNNLVKFEDKIQDAYGMPQPTFNFELGPEDREASHEMMRDMEKVAGTLGGYLPGSEPQFLSPGLALHVCGTTRAGEDRETSCCDKNSKVWNTDNLYVGGLNVIPGSNGSNPTLTAMCFAIQGAKHILDSLKNNKP